MTNVNTVTGSTDTSELGLTLMHEHIVLQSPAVQANWSRAFDRDAAKATAVSMLRKAEAAGVGTIVDMTTADNGRDIALIREIVAETTLRVIVATGLWLQVPRFFQMSEPDRAAQLFVGDIREGINGTDIKAGIIKAASDDELISSPLQDMAFRAAARASRQTGAPLYTHSNAARKGGLDQQRIFAEEGVDLSRVVIGHSGDTEDLSYLKQMLERGSYLGMDRFGLTHFGEQRFLTTGERAAVVARLCKDGYAGQIVLSHDTSAFPDGRTVEYQERTWPDWHYCHIPLTVIPALIESGVSELQVQQMTRENPRRIFECVEPY